MELKLKQAVRLNPDSFQANHNVGELYIQQGKLETAIPYLEKAQQIQPSHYVNGYDLALAYLETQKLAKARQRIQDLLQRKDSAELHNLLGEVEEQSGNSVAAADEYQRAAHMEPSEKHIFDWGNQLLLHQALEPAVQVFGHGVERYPRSAKLRIGLGIALYSRSHYDEAIQSLCAAVDLDPSDPRPYFFLGKMYDISSAMAGEVTRRLALFVEQQPRNALAHYYYALSLWKSQRGENSQVDLNQVEALLKTAVKLDPKSAETYFQLGTLHSDQQKYAEAIGEYQLAVKLQPDFADAHYRLGKAYLRMGQKAQAQEQMEIYQRLHAQKLKQTGKRGGDVVFTVNEVPKKGP
jgi:tetratricopeptide (TPR) repeat protein